MINLDPHVFIVEDNADYRDYLHNLMETMDVAVESYSSAYHFLSAYIGFPCECLITDNQMPGMTGAELQIEMALKSPFLPVIIISGNIFTDEAITAIHNGAFDVIEKPASAQKLCSRTEDAFAVSAIMNVRTKKEQELNSRLNRLTSRENEILECSLAGKRNKGIAGEMNIAEKTVQAHRNNIKIKLDLDRFIDVLRMENFLNNVKIDVIELLDSIDMDESNISKMEICVNSKHCHLSSTDVGKIFSEDLNRFKKANILITLIDVYENCETRKVNYCVSRDLLTKVFGWIGSSATAS